MARGRDQAVVLNPEPGTRIVRIGWIVCLALCCTAAVRAADPPPRENKPTLHEAIEQVRRETGGRILSAETVGRGKNQVYRIKVLTPQGSVRVVQVPTRKE